MGLTVLEEKVIDKTKFLIKIKRDTNLFLASRIVFVGLVNVLIKINKNKLTN